MLRNNIIKKTILELQYNGSRDGFALQNELTAWANDELIRIVGEHLEKVDQPDKITRIDKLNLEIEVAEGYNWRDHISRGIVTQLNHELENKLATQTGGTQIEQVTTTMGFFEGFIHFLQHGYLPWWNQSMSKEEFLTGVKRLLESEPHAETKKILIDSLRSEVARRRLILQPDEIFLNMVSILLPGIEQDVRDLWKDISAMRSGSTQEESKNLAETFKTTVLEKLYAPAELQTADTVMNTFIQAAINSGEFNLIERKLDKIKGESFKKEIRHTSFRLHKQPGIEQTGKKQDLAGHELWKTKADSEIDGIAKYAETINQPEGIYINNAGLVIVASFLPLLFKKLLLADEGKISQINKAICLVQYLASGKENIAEFELVLPKILCGVDIQKPVDTEIYLKENEKQEVNEVLLSVIEYWNILKNTSVEGLRESFLMRNGKLWFEDNEWHLQVEQRPYDMLLQQLPWNISMIRLPWMKYILKTNWIH